MTKALEQCLQVMLRMIPDACEEHGEDRSAWPAGVQKAADGEYE